MKKSRKTFLTYGQRDTLASCVVIISAFIFSFNFVGISAKAYQILIIVDIVYALFVYGSFLVFKEKITSQETIRIMIFLGVLGALVSIILLWFVFNLPF